MTAEAGAAPPTLRVLHVLGTLDRGGAETRLLELLGHLPPGRVESHFLLLGGRAGEMADEARALGAVLHVTRLGPGALTECWRLLRRIRPTAVHAHVQYSSGPFLALARLCRVPRRIAHFRSTTDVRPGRREGVRRRVQRTLSAGLISSCATDVVAVSGAVLAAQWPPGRRPAGRVLWNGVSTEGVTVAEPTGPPVVVQVGRLDPLKDQAAGVEAVAALARRRPDVRLQLVGRGGGPYEAAVRARAVALGLADRVEFTGVRHDVRTAVLPRAAALLHPTRVEGLPGVVIEAAAVGTPVVASDIGPNREVADLVPGVRLVALEAPPERWADLLEECLAHRVTAAERREALAAFAQGPFAMAHHVAAMTALWEPAP